MPIDPKRHDPRTSDPREDEPQDDSGLLSEAPGFAQRDWAEIEAGELVPETFPSNDDLLDDDEPAEGELPGEDDDNPYMESDEALPDDDEERAIRRDLSREGGPFNEV